MTEVSANRGEWSELFALASILDRGGAYAADGQLRPIKNRFLKVTKILLNRGLSEGRVVYGIHKDGTLARTVGNDSQILSQAELSSSTRHLLLELQGTDQVGNFSSKPGVELLRLLGLEKPSAASSEMSSDFELVLEDPGSGEATPSSAFSVKSQLGAPATLLNASKQTNVTFSLGSTESMDERFVADLNRLKWVETRDALLAAGCEPEFRYFDGTTFSENLTKVDSSMPEVLANLLRCHYFDGVVSLREATEHCYPPHLPISAQANYKIRELMGVLAMGMRPNYQWSGDPSAFKGMVIVKKTGDVVLFYLFNVLEFRDFLFSTLKFERGSSNRHGWGQIYESEGEWRVKLNLQLRFMN